MALDDVFKVRFEFSQQDVVWSVTRHYQDKTGVDPLEAANDLVAIANPMQANEMADCISDDVRVEACYACPVVAESALPALFQHNNVTGAVTGSNALPANSAAVFSFQSDDPLLKRSGRIYLAGLAKSSVQDGNLTAAWLGTPGAALKTKLSADLSGALGTWRPIIYRTVDNGAPLPTPIVVEVDTVTVLGTIFTQRRRTGRRRGTANVAP